MERVLKNGFQHDIEKKYFDAERSEAKKFLKNVLG